MASAACCLRAKPWRSDRTAGQTVLFRPILARYRASAHSHQKMMMPHSHCYRKPQFGRNRSQTFSSPCDLSSFVILTIIAHQGSIYDSCSWHATFIFAY